VVRYGDDGLRLADDADRLRVVVAVIAAVVWAIVSLTARPCGDTARRTLDERYAGGEIGDDEYRRMKRQLG
jgi:putative membrane protein